MGSATSKTAIVELNNLNDSIYVFHNPADQKKIKAKFIFFHDIQWTGDEKAYVQTWMSRGSPSICWPKEWLSKRYPDAQILSACYDAGYGKARDTGHFRMDLLAENLLQDILSVCVTNCPTFLMGHGLGGIVIKAVIRAMQRKRDAMNNRGPTYDDLKNIIHKFDCFLGNVKGVCFYNTPFLGSKFVNSRYFPNKVPLLDTLEMFNTYTCDLNEFFREWRKYRRCRATAIYAVHPANMPFWSGGPLLAWMNHQGILLDCIWMKKKVPLVEEGAARFDVDDFYAATKSDHFSVCKPHKEEDSSFQRLIELIEWVLGRTDEPGAHIKEVDPVRKKWTEYVEAILIALPNLEEDEDVVQLDPLHLAQLGEFEDILGKLINGLKDAGFEKTHDDSKWEREHNQEFLEDNSPAHD